MVRGRVVTISIVALHVLVAFWVIGVLKPDTFRYVELGDSITLMLVFDRGEVRTTCWLATDPPAATYAWTPKRYGFGVEAEVNITPTNKVNRKYCVIIPIWAMLAVCLFYPTLAFFRGPVTRLRRRALNCCVPCGYSLTGNVSGICPECGSAVPRRAHDGSYLRITDRIEVKLWRWTDSVTARRVVMTVVVVAMLAIGIDVLRDRPWESATTRAYRLCQADGATRKQIDTAILGLRGGFPPGNSAWRPLSNAFPGNALLRQLSDVFSNGAPSWSEACLAAMKDVANSSTPPAPVWTPPPKP